MRVALDAMGGDHAPREPVAGALEAARADSGIQVLLVGCVDVIGAEIERQGGAPGNVSIVPASDTVPENESPVEALKRRPDASVLKAVQLVGAGLADAVISAGPTGATAAAALMTLKRQEGITRPGIAVRLPAKNPLGIFVLLDAGANPGARAHHLCEYAFLGADYYRRTFGGDAPRVALVATRHAREVVAEATELLRATNLEFVGAVEAAELFGDACEVAVADGSTGNLVLKTLEGLGDMLREELGDARPASVRAIDYAETGGEPLLGVAGTVLISHRRSNRRAIGNAIRNAVLTAARSLVRETRP